MSSWFGRDSGYALLRLASGEVRMVRSECLASIGAVSNADHQNIVYRQGWARALGWVIVRMSRGVAMNPIDHPHGGGEGRSSGGPSSGHAVGQADQGQEDAS